MKKQYLFAVMIFLVLPLAFAYVCQDETDIKNIPCEVITPVIVWAGACNSTTSFVVHPEVEMNVTMTAVGDGTYNFTFNYTNLTSYSIVTCNNYTATMNVRHLDEDYNDKWLYFYGGTLLIGCGLLISGFKMQDNIMTLLSGFLIIAFAIAFVFHGYPELTSTLVFTSIVVISLGAGLYITTRSAIGLIQEDS